MPRPSLGLKKLSSAKFSGKNLFSGFYAEKIVFFGLRSQPLSFSGACYDFFLERGGGGGRGGSNNFVTSILPEYSLATSPHLPPSPVPLL